MAARDMNWVSCVRKIASAFSHTVFIIVICQYAPCFLPGVLDPDSLDLGISIDQDFDLGLYIFRTLDIIPKPLKRDVQALREANSPPDSSSKNLIYFSLGWSPDPFWIYSGSEPETLFLLIYLKTDGFSGCY